LLFAVVLLWSDAKAVFTFRFFGGNITAEHVTFDEIAGPLGWRTVAPASAGFDDNRIALS
jgi:hypothetical protein